MKRLLLSSMMVIALVGNQTDLNAKATWDKAVKKVQQSLVYIQSGPAVCTGFVIDEERRYVMTAAHCRNSAEIWADRSRSRVVGFDTNKDMMVLQVEELNASRRRLKLAKKDARAQHELVAIGFAHGLEQATVIHGVVIQRSAMIWGVSGNPYVMVRPTFIGGQSGGPAVNIHGDVVLIIQMGSEGANIGLGTSTTVIRERMGHFFS